MHNCSDNLSNIGFDNLCLVTNSHTYKKLYNIKYGYESFILNK